MNIRCAQCKKLVDVWEAYYDANRMVTHVTVWCHGEMDQCELSDRFVIEAGRDIPDGTAFATKRLVSQS